MLSLLLILLIGLMPSLISVWVIRQADARVRMRLRLAATSSTAGELSNLRLSPDHHYIDGLGYVVGDWTCRFNARSSDIRCAVNPFGPCDSCSCYERRELSEDS